MRVAPAVRSGAGAGVVGINLPAAKAGDTKAAKASGSLNAGRAQARQAVERKPGLRDAIFSIVRPARKKTVSNVDQLPRLHELSPAWRDGIRQRIKEMTDSQTESLFCSEVANAATLCNTVNIKTVDFHMGGGAARAQSQAVLIKFTTLREFAPGQFSTGNDTSEKRFFTLAMVSELCRATPGTAQSAVTLAEIKKECEKLLAHPEDLNTAKYQQTFQQVREKIFQYAQAAGAVAPAR